MATRTIDLFDVTFDIDYSATPYRAATFDSPAEGGDLEVEVIYIAGHDVTDILSDKAKDLIHEHVANQLESWADEDRDEQLQDQAEAHAFDLEYREAA